MCNHTQDSSTKNRIAKVSLHHQHLQKLELLEITYHINISLTLFSPDMKLVQACFFRPSTRSGRSRFQPSTVYMETVFISKPPVTKSISSMGSTMPHASLCKKKLKDSTLW